MEIKPEMLLLEENEFNHYENVHLIYFAKLNNEIFFLLEKETSDVDSKYSHFFRKIDPLENSPIISISRHLTIKYKGLFSSRLLEKIYKKQKLVPDDFEYLNFNEFIYPERNSNEFFTNIKKFNSNPIQFDRIKGNILYFLPIDYFDTTFLSQNLNEALNTLSNDFQNDNQKLKEQLSSLLALEFRFFALSEMQSFIGSTKKDNCLFDENFLEILNTINPKKLLEESDGALKNEKILLIDMHDQEKQAFDENGFFLYLALFSGIYRKSNQEWIHIRPFEEDLPDLDMILNDESYKAIIIPGSHLHVYAAAQEEFLMKTKNWIYNLHHSLKNIQSFKNKNLKLLGICFGHQLISYSLGAPVRKRLQGERCNTVENLKISTEDNNNLSFFRKLFNANFETGKLNLCEIHFDEVFEKPSGMEKIAASDSCEFEIFLSENNRILTFQGHPEYTPEYQLFDTFPLKSKNLNLDQQKNFSEVFLAMQYRNYEYSYVFREVCFNFINCKYL